VLPAGAQVTHGPPRIRDVYIPSEELKILFDDPSKGVVMQRDKVMALWEEARRRAPSPATPPADTVLSQATYEAQLDDHRLRVSGRIQIAALREGWQTVDLPFGAVAIESARLGGEPARFGRKDDGTLFLVLEKEGRFELDLEMSAPLASKGGDLATTLKLPAVPASEMLLWLDKGKQLQLGETALPSDDADNARQRFRIAVGRAGLVPLVISERFAGGNRAPLVLANSHATSRIELAGLRWEVVLDLDVYARATDTFRLQLPGSVDLAEVESPGLDRWTARPAADGTAVVTLSFRKPVLGRRSVRLLGLAPITSAAQGEIPTVRVPDAAAHVGRVSVYGSPSLRIKVGELSGIRPERLPSGPAETSPATGTPLTFAFWDENFKLPLRVTERRRAVQASMATLVEVNRVGAVLRGSVTVEPRYAPLFDVQVQLPRDWEVASVLSGGKPVEWEAAPTATAAAAGGAGWQTIRFDFAEPLVPGRSLEIVVTARRQPDRWLEQDERFQELPLPDLRLIGADEVEGTVMVQAPPDIELLASDLSDNLQPVAAHGPAQVSGTVLEYRYREDSPKSGRLQVRMKPARVSAETLAFVRLDRGKLDVHYQADLHIRQGTMRQLQFTLPASAGEKIQIVPVDSAVRIIEQRHSPLRNAAEKTELSLWQVVLDRPIAGDLTLALDFGQTVRVAAGDGAAAGAAAGESAAAESGAGVALPILAFQNVSRQSGMVAVEAADDQQIGCQPENLRDLDPADVRKPKAYVPGRRIVAAYQYQRLPYRLAISATRHVSGSVLTGVCESAEIISVAGHGGRMRHQARFRLRSLNLPDVPVALPQDADLWSAALDGAPIEVRRTPGLCIVPLPAGPAGSTDASRELTLLYETQGPPLDARGLRGRLWPQTVRQTAPEIALTTLGTTWHVHPPDGTDLVSSGGDFRPETPLTRPSLAAGLAETIARQSALELPWKLAGLAAAAVLAGFFVLFWTSKGCAVNLTQALVIITVIGVLIALLLPATQSARESARRAQCMNNLKQIGLALLNYHEQYKQFPPAAIGPSNVPRQRQFSWIVAILPFMEQQPLYSQLRLDLPCDDPHNAALLRIPLSTVLCPSDPSRTTTEEGLCKTSYVAVTGADSTRGPGSTRGVIGLDRGLRIDEVVDGTSNTIMVAEVADGGPWFAGGTGTARRIDGWIEKKTWSEHAGGGNFLFADGSVHFLSSGIDPQTLRDMATAQGLEPVAKTLESEVTEKAPEAAKEAAPATPATAPALPAQKEEEARPAAAPGVSGQNKPAPQVPAQEPAQRPQPQAEANAPAKSPTPMPVPPGVARGQRSRLSLSVAIETRGGEAVRFRREGGQGELIIGVQDRAFADTVQWFLVAAALLAAWLWRRRPVAQRAIAVVVGLAAPIGLSGLVPLVWTPLLDGVLLGALVAGCLWALPWILAALKTVASTTPPRSTASAIIVGLGLALVAKAGAAEEPRGKGESPPAAGQAREPDLTLFIPYDPTHGKPLDSTRVYLKHDEFLRLWKQAHPEKPKRASPSVQAVVSHAEYAGRLQGDAASFDGRLLIHHFADGWTRTVLPLGKVALEKIESDGRPATLAGEDHDQPAIYLDKPGPHVVDVHFSVPVSRLGATGQVSVPLRPVSSGLLLFELPREPLDVEVSGDAGGWRLQTSAADDKNVAYEAGGQRSAEAAGGAATGPRATQYVRVPLGAAGELSIRWQPRRIEARVGELMSADQALLIEVLDSGVHLHSRFHWRIQQGAVREIRFRVPPGVAVQGVRGDDVADWSMESEPAAGTPSAGQRLVVSLKTERTDGTDVDIDSFRRNRRPGIIDIDAPEPLGVARETGRMALGCAGPLRVRVGKTEGLDQIDRTGLDLPRGSSEACGLVSAYRYTSRPWLLQLESQRDRPRVEVSERTAVAVTARQAVLESLLTADVSGGAVRSLALRLPDSLRVSQVVVPAGADWFIDAGDKGRQLRVELSEPVVGRLDMGVSGVVVRDSHQAEFALPGITVEEAATHRGQLAIYLDDDLQAVLADDGGARSIEPSAVDAALRPAGNRPAQYAFQYESPPKNLRLRLASAPSRAGAEVTTVVSVREGAVAYVSRVDFEIRQAGRSRFQIAAPEWLGDDVEVRGQQIRQIRSEAAGPTRTWDIELQQSVRGTYRLHLLQTLPLPDDGTVRAAVLQPIGVERLRGHIVLDNATADEIAATTTTGVAPVPIAAVPEGLADALRRQAVAAYRVTGDNAVLAWQRRAREQETGLTAAVNMADLTTVINADGGYRARAIYNIRNFTLQFLELELPPGSRIWSVHVSGQPVRPATVRRQGRTVTLLPLQKTSAGDFASKVEVIYSGDLGAPLRRWARVEPPAPQILSDVPVSRTLWTVLLPHEYEVSLVKGQSNLEEVEAAYQQEERKLSFLDEVRQMVQVASSRSGSAARTKAQDNLKQVGVALDDYAGQAALTGAKNAADVQAQAQQIAAEVKRLEELKSESRRADDETYYFKQPSAEPKGAETGADWDRAFERLPVPDTTGSGTAAPKEPEKNPQIQAHDRADQRRGDLRKQAAEQLTKLQTLQQEGLAGDQRAGKPSPHEEAAPLAPAAAAGQLPLALELPLVGTAHHFCKLQGQPRLVLRAWHENLYRGLSALAWAALCLAVAAVLIGALRHPDALARAYRSWPWLAALAGAAWLFLLPAGIIGWALLVTALGVLVGRWRKACHAP
jgi:prepilin-type processing-associated H-X9-DG protein